MNCSQYSYGQTPQMDQTQSRDMMTRPMQPNGMDKNMSKPMGMQPPSMSTGRMTGMQTPSMSTGRMTDMQTPSMSTGRMAGMQTSPMSTDRMRETQGPAMTMPDTGRGISPSMTPPPGGWNLPSTTAQPLAMQTPTTVESPYYTAGFLRNFIGKTMRVEFLIGTSGALVDRTGELVEVGASYIVLKPSFTDDLLMCDLYAIKFVTIYQ